MMRELWRIVKFLVTKWMLVKQIWGNYIVRKLTVSINMVELAIKVRSFWSRLTMTHILSVIFILLTTTFLPLWGLYHGVFMHFSIYVWLMIMQRWFPRLNIIWQTILARNFSQGKLWNYIMREIMWMNMVSPRLSVPFPLLLGLI